MLFPVASGPGTSPCSLVVTRAMSMDTHSCCCVAMDPGWPFTMGPSSRAGHTTGYPSPLSSLSSISPHNAQAASLLPHLTTTYLHIHCGGSSSWWAWVTSSVSAAWLDGKRCYSPSYPYCALECQSVGGMDWSASLWEAWRSAGLYLPCPVC